MADNNLKNLEKFAKELGDTLSNLKGSKILDKETKKHQKNLEHLLEVTNKILKKSATDQEIKGFDSLLKSTEMSFKLLKQSHKNDEEFKQEYTRVVNDFDKTQTFSQSILKNIAVSLTSIKNSVGILNEASIEDVENTALGFLSGPFGQIVKESADTSGIKEQLSGVFSRSKSTNNIDGQAHDGMTNIPREGTYMLDGGERVLSPEQNKDLSGFLDEMGKDKLQKVYNVGHDRTYFDPLIETSDKIYSDERSLFKKQHKEQMTKFEILNDVISRINLGWFSSFIIGIDIWYKRFKRHPLLTTMQGVINVFSGTIKTFSKVIGLTGLLSKFFLGDKAKTDTDRIVQSNEDIVSMLETGQKIDRRSGLGRLLDNIFKKEKVNVKDKFSKKEQKSFNEDVQINKGVWKLVELTEKMIKKIKKSSEGSMLTSILGGLGGKLGKLKVGALAAGGAALSMGSGLLKSGASKAMSFGKLAVGWLSSLGSVMLKAVTTVGPKIFGFIGTKILGAIGIAWTAGDLIGTYVVNPLLKMIDETFNTNIIDGIGRAMTKFLASMEGIPLIGRFIGGGAAETLEQTGETSYWQDLVARFKDEPEQPKRIERINNQMKDSKESIELQKRTLDVMKSLDSKYGRVTDTIVSTTKPAIEDMGTYMMNVVGQ